MPALCRSFGVTKKYVFCLLGVAAIIALDRAFKIWATANVKDTTGRDFIPGLVKLVYVENRGAAFGIFENMRWLFVVLGVAVTVGIVWFTVKERLEAPVLLAGLTLITGGTIGNMVDRAVSGYVVDMFQLEFVNFAISNVADVALTCGGIITCLYILVKKPF